MVVDGNREIQREPRECIVDIHEKPKENPEEAHQDYKEDFL
ncbi:hypothetical protein ACT9DO_004445 [Salmonella enterica subsp. enterica serovar Catumagos]